MTKTICTPRGSRLGLVLIGWLLFAPTVLPAQELVRINGSGTCLETLRPLAAAYRKAHPEVVFEIGNPLGSSGALKALNAGALDLAVVSRPLKATERDQGLKLRPWALTPLVIVTERGVTSANISTAELEAIYAGRSKQWPDGQTVRVILRPLTDTDTRTLKKLSTRLAQAIDQAHQRRGVLVAVSDTESNAAVAKTRGALGCAGLSGVLAAGLPLNILSLNGVSPSRASLAAGTYPLAKAINLVTRRPASRATENFMAFLDSAQSRQLADEFGLLFVKPPR